MTCVQGTSASKLDSSLQGSPVHTQLQAADYGPDDSPTPGLADHCPNTAGASPVHGHCVTLPMAFEERQGHHKLIISQEQCM